MAVMTQKEMRQIALGAARARMRMMEIDPKYSDSNSALAVLDDNYRTDPDTIAAIWYGNASDNQIKMFKREWKNG